MAKQKRIAVSFFLVLTLFFSCTKEKEDTYCWSAVDRSGVLALDSVLCNKTKAEAEAAYPDFIFYRHDEEQRCWAIQQPQGQPVYVRRMPETIMAYFFPSGAYNYTEVDCNSFCIWRSYEKSRSKVTGLYNPTRVYVETYAADSCSKLYAGRNVTVREAADSIIYREFFEEYNP